MVDAADYFLWRKTDWTQQGYDTWRMHFGETAGNGSGASANTNVLEPVTVLLMTLAAAGVSTRRRRCAWRVSKLINA